MKKTVLVGTHHKTGTVWMKEVFDEISNRLNVPLYDISDSPEYPSLEKKRLRIEEVLHHDESAIVYDYHSKFPIAGLTQSRLRGLHLVRDPRDVVISSARYHCWSEEAWLHQPMDKFDGLTYSQKIKSLDDFAEQMIFEMDHSAGGQIKYMSSFDSGSVFKNVKYEDLMSDRQMFLWHEIAVFLGFEGDEIPVCLSAFWNNSLFGGKQTATAHVQDGSSRQYETHFTSELIDEFNSRFPEALATLGYA